MSGLTNKQACTPQPYNTSNHYRVDLTGVWRAAVKYHLLKRRFYNGLAWKYLRGIENPSEKLVADELRRWARGTSGFSRAHMPYWIEVPAYLKDAFVHAIRQDETTPVYDMILSRSWWV